MLGIVTELGVDVTVVPLQSKDAVIVYVFSGCRPLSKNTKSLSIGEVRLDPDKTELSRSWFAMSLQRGPSRTPSPCAWCPLPGLE